MPKGKATKKHAEESLRVEATASLGRIGNQSVKWATDLRRVKSGVWRRSGCRGSDEAVAEADFLPGSGDESRTVRTLRPRAAA